MGATQTQEEKFIHMTQEPVPHLICELAGPTIISMLVTSFYNMADTFFVGQVGTSATGAVGIAFSVMAVIQAFGFFFGHGSGNYVSRKLGAQEFDEAAKMAATGFVSAFIMGLVIMAAGLAFLDPLCHMLGATDTILPYARSYLGFILIGAPYMTASLVLNNQLRFQGSAFYAMIGIASGAVINIVLDPIFIFALGMGVRGAALATVLSQAVSALWVLSFLCSKRSVIRIKISNMKPSGRIMGRIASLGIAPFIMQSTESLVNIVLNTGLQIFGGDLYVGSMTIMQSVMQMLVMPINGITQGAQPIMSYNYGAKNYARVRETFRLLLKITLTVTVVCCLLLVLFPGVPARMFTSEQALIDLVKKTMPVFFAGIWAFGAQMACQTTFMALGQAKTSLFLALLRKIILLIPLALILPRMLGGVMGIYIAEPIADIVASCTTLTLFLVRRKTLLPEDKK